MSLALGTTKRPKVAGAVVAPPMVPARSLMLVVIGLVLSTLMSPPSLAVSVFDDDAGSGRDAPDVAALALPIEPGTHSGRVDARTDLVDYYAVWAQEGDVLTLQAEEADVSVVLVDIHGRPHTGVDAWRPPPPDSFMVVPATGWQVVLVATTGREYWADTHYTFSVQRETLGHHLIHEQAGPQVMEFRWDVPTDLRMEFSIWFADQVGSARANFFIVELDLVDASGVPEDGYFAYHHHIRGEGAAIAVATEGAPARLDRRLPTDVPTGLPGTTIVDLWSFHQVTGTVRISSYAIGAAHAQFSVVSDAQPIHATWAADPSGIVAWRTGEGSEERLAGPGLVSSSASETSFLITDRFFGFLSQNGICAEQDGTARSVDSDFFLAPPLGEWRLSNKAEVMRTGEGAEEVWFDGAHLPTLGIAPVHAYANPAIEHGNPCP